MSERAKGHMWRGNGGINGNSRGGREAAAKAIGELVGNGMALCSLGFHKGLPASQSVSHKSPRVVVAVVFWSFPVSPVTMVSGRLHHSREHKGKRLFPIFP